MSKATVTIEGYTTEPRRKTTQSGEVVTVSVGHTPRRKNRDTGDWEDAGPTVWFEADFWRGEADQIVKGTHVILTGSPELSVYAGKDGSPHGSTRVRFATVAVVQEPARSGAGRGRGAPQTSTGGDWASAGQTGAQSGAWAFDSETPF